MAVVRSEGSGSPCREWGWDFEEPQGEGMTGTRATIPPDVRCAHKQRAESTISSRPPPWTPQAEIVDLARRELAGNPNGAEHGGRECRRRRWHDLTTPAAGYDFRDGQ